MVGKVSDKECLDGYLTLFLIAKLFKNEFNFSYLNVLRLFVLNKSSTSLKANSLLFKKEYKSNSVSKWCLSVTLKYQGLEDRQLLARCPQYSSSWTTAGTCSGAVRGLNAFSVSPESASTASGQSSSQA